MTGTQLQNAVAFWQTMTALGLSLAVESFCLAPGQVCACRAARWFDGEIWGGFASGNGTGRGAGPPELGDSR